MKEPAQLLAKGHHLIRRGRVPWMCLNCARFWSETEVGVPALLPWCKPRPSFGEPGKEKP